MADTIFYYSDTTTSTSSDTTLTSSSWDNTKTLTEVTVGDTVTTIGTSAFASCTSLTTVTFIGNNLQFILTNAFLNCQSLDGIIVPNSVTFIGATVFASCYSLTSIIIPDLVTSIQSGTFSNCQSLVNVTIGNKVSTIGSFAFNNCTSLTKLILPASIRTIPQLGVFGIGSLAFNGCTNLTKIYFLGNAPTYTGNSWNNMNPNVAIFRKKNFRTGWSSSIAGIPVLLWSDNITKSGGSGKLTTKKRTFGLPNEIYLTITGCDALCTGGWCRFDGDFASYPFYRGGNDEFGLGSKRWYNDGNDIMIIYDGDEGYFNMANHWLIIDPYEQLLYFKRPSSDPNNIPTDGWQVGVETLCQNGQVIISK